MTFFKLGFQKKRNKALWPLALRDSRTTPARLPEPVIKPLISNDFYILPIWPDL
jgi:hypothetical protein